MLYRWKTGLKTASHHLCVPTLIINNESFIQPFISETLMNASSSFITKYVSVHGCVGTKTNIMQ